MKFVDSVRVSVKAGRGGNGCMSFLRERFKPYGGPDGGNGGKGGSVIFEAVSNLQTLADFEYKRHIKGADGTHGKGACRNGAAGRDIIMPVPCGTIIYDDETNEGLADLVEAGDRFLAARGGRGGRGNRYFATSSRKAPRFCENGDMGEDAKLRLELKLIADVGLVGLPNVGKSSILAAISNAQPKIANYPFTTLSPNLGVICGGYERIVIADIPGLIEGAHEDKGLGLAFLRHVDRSRLLIHVLSVEGKNKDTVLEEFETVRSEMRRYDSNLDNRPYFVAANKTDTLEEGSSLLRELGDHFAALGVRFCSVSALSGDGIPELAEMIVGFAGKYPRQHSEVRLYALGSMTEKQPLPARYMRDKIQIISLHGGGYKIMHRQLEKAAERYDLSQDENVARFTRLLRKYKVEELLEAAGAKEGDTINVGYKDFIFYPDYYPAESAGIEEGVEEYGGQR